MLVYAVLWLLFAIFSAVGAGTKNRSCAGWFFIGLLFGPFGLLVFAMPKLEPEKVASQKQSDTKPGEPALITEASWDCLNCNYPNGGSRTTCEGCGQVREHGETICPMCRETIKVGALKCKHCGELFDEPVGTA